MRSFFILCTLFILISCGSSEQKKLPQTAKENIGEQFTLGNIVDTTGNKIALDFTTSEITIIDFWNNGCPPCIEEMKQFPALIKGKDSKVSVFSISLTQYWLWKPTLQEHKAVFAFLDYDVPNWKQYNLLTVDNPRSKNEISVDRLDELSNRYHINFNPAYLVVNKKGTIIARPESAVEYLKNLPL